MLHRAVELILDSNIPGHLQGSQERGTEHDMIEEELWDVRTETADLGFEF